MAKKKVMVIAVSSILLVAMVVAVAVVVTHKGNHGGSSGEGGSSGAQISTTSKAVQQLCQPTDYKAACENALSSAGNTSDPKTLIKIAFNVTVKHIGEAIRNSSFLQKAVEDPRVQDALENCRELLEYSINDLQRSFNQVDTFELSEMNIYIADIKTWLSGAITYQQTCLDGFDNTTGDTGEQMKKYLQLSSELSSNGLAIVTEMSKVLASYNLSSLSMSRKLLSGEPEVGADGYPSWLSGGRRGLLQATPATEKPNVVVAQDGSGKYKTINEALNEIPKNGAQPFIIYIKAGVYKEYVNITKNMNNVFLLGDGPTKTKITGNRSFVGGYNTYRTATVSVDGDQFMAKDIGFENSAGAAMHQAVALRMSSDLAIIYNCQIDGYQDTLYAHVHRQFYRDCTISGTIDFIFGNAAVVFQNCKMVVRKPDENQNCMVTAQGRTDKRGTTGIVLQNCTITADPEYVAGQANLQYKAYLGRPWKNFSRTVVMQSQIDNVIDPEGWAPWIGTLNLDTLWYAEINNRGPGAALTHRVKWAGLQTISSQAAAQVAAGFTASNFINGDTWIPVTMVPYVSGMMNV
ncbi:Pectinesterase [Actinidia chinensis var. chinensis]|uniref:Pectinesterase n=1 Tax=Actinidia chinensis var. chinensis TaxID=1590841 RepID=A0A2R6Q3T8_ACTCC|nr:Pectinesterase [Actinidia chinensis var. chinensis]